MRVRRKRIVWAAAAAALLLIVLGSVWIARLRFAESEAELKARLSDADLSALVTWGRGTALAPGAPTTRWAAGDLPEPLRRIGVRWAATSTFAGDTFVFFHLHGENGKSGLLVADPTARWPNPPADWSQWKPGLWYHRE